jgi:RNA polymerase sigma factor (sigma-70 family)
MTNFTTAERHALVLDHVYLAEKIAKSRKKKLTQVSYDELKSAAYLGLVEAAAHYISQENDCFPAYAVWRIIGAVRDYLRELSWGPRSNPVKMVEVFVFEEHIFDQQIVDRAGFFEDVIRQLPTVNKTVLKLYYQEGMKIKEIASDLGVHQSRVSQILSDSRLKLKNIWKEQQAELWAAAA